MEEKLIWFDDSYVQGPVELASDNPDAVGCVTIDGYPSNEAAEGKPVCAVYRTRSGDTITHWNLNAYRLDPSVRELVEKAKERLGGTGPKAQWKLYELSQTYTCQALVDVSGKSREDVEKAVRDHIRRNGPETVICNGGEISITPLEDAVTEDMFDKYEAID